MRGRVHNGNRVDVLVLDIDGVVILVHIFDFGVEDTSHRHIEALPLIIAGWAADGSSTRSTTLSLAERSHSRDLGASGGTGVAIRHGHDGRARVHIGVLQLNGVIILVPLVHLCISLDAGRVGADEAIVAIIARRPTDRGTASLGMEARMSIDRGSTSLGAEAIIARRSTDSGTTSLGLLVLYIGSA